MRSALNLPNLLTLSRLVAVPPLMLLVLVHFPMHDQVAAVVFLGFSLTDSLDGMLARRLGLVTSLGKLLDPFADKVFIIAILFVLVQESLLPAWVAVVITGRELLITGIRTIGATQGVIISATPFGKTKTVAQIAAVELVVLSRPYPTLGPVAVVVVAAALLFTIYSGLDYAWRYRKLIGL